MILLADAQAFCLRLDKVANIGYDQGERWDFYRNGKLVLGATEGDCSTVCGAIAKEAGIPVVLSGTFYTGNYAIKMKAAGCKVIRFESMSQVKVGDFLLTPGHHVEFVYSETKMFSAHQDERGRASGGKAGDQTGKEVGFRTLANRPGGWTYIIRPQYTTVTKPVPVVVPGIVITEAQLAAALKAAGSSTVRAKVCTGYNAKGERVYTATSLKDLAAMATVALKGQKLTRHGVAAWVGTMLQESAWLATTVEYGADKKRYDPYRGRSFEQITWKDNYAAFGVWAKSRGLITDANLFVDHPDELGKLGWAWVGGIWYFSARKLWGYGNSGDFQRVQTAVNMGTASGEKYPAGWDARLSAYRAFLSAYGKPAALAVDGDFGTKSWKRVQEFLGVEIDGQTGGQTYRALRKWLGYSDGDVLNSGVIGALQSKIGVSKDGDWGPKTSTAFQKYLNAHR